MYGCFKDVIKLKRSAEGIEMDIDCHDITPRVVPHFLKWMSTYGRTFLFWFGPIPHIFISDVELVKQVLLDRTGFLLKSDFPTGTALVALLGKGLPLNNGPDWARHRRVRMTGTMTDCTKSMTEAWENQITREKKRQVEIDLSDQFLELTADVICHTAIGSSFKQGKEVFSAQKELMMLAFECFLKIQFPGFGYLPTKNNRKIWRLDKMVRRTLRKIIHERMELRDGGYGNDLLGLMLETCMSMNGGKESNNYMSMDEIIDECKTFFFVGHETTAHLLSWTMFYLSSNVDWQTRLREEVLRECGREVPNADMLSKLKLVNMVLLEALRLYGSGVAIYRKASQDMKLGTVNVLKGTSIAIPIAILHRDKEIWGPDADKFNPLRFGNGPSKAAKHTNALLAFSLGPRSCIGQTFAMLEAKAVISMVLQRFSFHISPNYVHKPINIIALQPMSGLQVIVEPIKA